MSDASGGQRHSVAEPADLIEDETKRAERESRNALEQFDYGKDAIKSFIDGERPFRLRLSLILALHREALKGIKASAGNFRPGDVKITGSQHTPPQAHLVPELVEDMCDYVNDHWESESPIHLASYVMWRLNWIHPFDDGNGRTSRTLSYVVLCVRLGYLVPGGNSIPAQIVKNRDPYFAALDAADTAFSESKGGGIDVSEMEALLGEYLTNQLYEVRVEATGEDPAGD